MGQAQGSQVETVVVNCYKCNKVLPPIRDKKCVIQEIYFNKRTHVYGDGAYFCFFDQPNGYQCQSCFWEQLYVDKPEIVDKKWEDEVHTKRTQLKVQDEASVLPANSHHRLHELSDEIDKWIEFERFSTRQISFDLEEIKDTYVPDTRAVFQNTEAPLVEDNISLSEHVQNIEQLFTDGEFEVSIPNVLALIRLVTDKDVQAEFVLSELITRQYINLETVFRDVLFQGCTRSSSLEANMVQPNIKILKWMQVFLLDQFTKRDEGGSTNISKPQTSGFCFGTSLMYIMNALQEAVNDRSECLRLTQALYHLNIHTKAFLDTELLDTCLNWQEVQLQDDNLRAIRFITCLIRAIDLISPKGSGSPRMCRWMVRACELLVNACVPSISDYNYRTLLTSLAKNGTWHPSDLVEVLHLLLKNYDPNDCYMPRVLEYSTSYRVPCDRSLSKHQSFAGILENKVESMEILEIIRKEVANETDKSLRDVLDEMFENGWVSCEDVRHITYVVGTALSDIRNFGYPEQLCEWQLHMFSDWANSVRLQRYQTLSDSTLVSSLVTLCCAVRHAKGYWPRVTQMVSWCLLLKVRLSKGRLLQIRTGEGKSCVIAMVATIFACVKKTVDIVTSSPLLAVRDSEEWADFYKLFRLTSSNNTNNSIDEQRLQCYQCPIVYGTVSLFAADILRQEFQLKSVRGPRKCDAVIIDEVDVMLLDQGVQFTYLSESYAGLRHLQPVLAMVWNAVTQYRPVCTQKGDIFYTGLVRPFYHAVCDVLISTDCNIDNHLQILLIGESEGILESGLMEKVQAAEQSVDSLKEVLTSINEEMVISLLLKLGEYVPYVFCPYTLDTNGIIQPAVDLDVDNMNLSVVPILVASEGMCMVLNDDEILLKQMIVDNLKDHISQVEISNTATIEISQHLQRFVENKLSIWVENSFKAVTMIEGREYIVKEENIVPIDYLCTGVVETNKKWSDGLQQFLEMKHRLAITDLSLVTNFMSNISLFLRYRGIYGVTGTLGSETDQSFIQEQFGVDLCCIPTNLDRKLYECDGVVCSIDTEWIDRVCDSVSSEIKNTTHGRLGRAALVICEDIKKAEIIYEALKRKVTDKIILYTRSDTTASEILSYTFTLGQVIVATNLAGRGTDINITKQICESGGLFVLVTFLPINKRVEEQAFGRAGRKGQPGTSQIILNVNHLPPDMKHLRDITQMKTQREYKYKALMSFMESGDVKVCLLRQSLFQLYCEQISHVHQMEFCSASEKDIMLNSLHEYWGMWLQIQSTKITNLHKDELEHNLNMSLNEALNTARDRRSPTNNIYHIINYGNNLLSMQQYKKASSLYSKAVGTNQRFASIAHYNKAYCILQTDKGSDIDCATTELENAHKKLNEYRDEAMFVKQLVELSWSVPNATTTNIKDSGVSTQTESSSGDVESDSEVENNLSSLNQSVESRLQLIGCLAQNIKESIGKLKLLKSGKHGAKTEVTTIFNLVHEGDTAMQRELYELWKHGLTFTFCVKKKPRFCWEGLVVAIIGVAQVVAGVIMLSITMGPLVNFSVGLIIEGVSDIIDGCVGMYKGDLQLSSWAASKAASVAISMVTFSASKLASKGFRPAMASLNSAWKEVKMIPTMLSKTAGRKTIMATMKKSALHAAKLAGKEVIQKSAIKGTNYLLEKAPELLMDEIRKALYRKIKTHMSKTFERSPLKKQVDRLISGNFNEPRPDQEEFVQNITKLAKEVVDPVISDEKMKTVSKQILTAIDATSHLSKFKESNCAAILEHIKPHVPMICDCIDAAWKIGTLCLCFSHRLSCKISKFCDKLDIAERDEYDIDGKLNSNIYERAGDEMATILSIALTNVFHQNVTQHGIQKLRNSLDKAVRDRLTESDETSETVKKISAAAIKRVASHMSTDRKPLPKNSRLTNKYIEDNLNDAAVGSFIDCRILSKVLDQTIEVYEMTGNAPNKLLIVETNGSVGSSIKVLYHKPHTGYKDGHWDAIIDGNVHLDPSEDEKTLFKAVARSLHQHESNASLAARAVYLKTRVINELQNNAERWEGLIEITEWAERLPK